MLNKFPTIQIPHLMSFPVGYAHSAEDFVKVLCTLHAVPGVHGTCRRLAAPPNPVDLLLLRQ